MTDTRDSARAPGVGGFPACGARLRATREELGLSVGDVASELHLAHVQIEALETDDWAGLPGTTYARGYLKSYARLLGLDAEALLSGAGRGEETESDPDTGRSRRAPPAASPPDAAAVATARSEASADAGRKAATRLPWGWIVAVVLVGAVLLAWHYELPRQLAAGPSASGGPAPETGAEPAVAAAEGAPETPTEPRFVVFEFEQGSWVDVRDARGERLLYRDFRPGRRIEIEGEPPFRVFLGTTRGVQVEYLGEVVSPDPDPGRLFARFVLGATSS